MVRVTLFNQPRSLLRPGFIFYDMDITSKGKTTKEKLEDLIQKWEMDAALCKRLIPDADDDMIAICVSRRNQLLSCIADLKTLLATT